MQKLDRHSPALRSVDPKTFETAMRIARGEMRSIEVTPDMVGGTLYTLGEAIFVPPKQTKERAAPSGAAISTAPAAKPLPIHTDEFLNDLDKKIVSALEKAGPTGLMNVADFFATLGLIGHRTEARAKATIRNHLIRLEKIGIVGSTDSRSGRNKFLCGMFFLTALKDARA